MTQYRSCPANFLSLFDNEFKMHITIQCETRAGMLQIACHFETIYIKKKSRIASFLFLNKTEKNRSVM